MARFIKRARSRRRSWVVLAAVALSGAGSVGYLASGSVASSSGGEGSQVVAHVTTATTGQVEGAATTPFRIP
jgi:hypothetical protein